MKIPEWAEAAFRETAPKAISPTASDDAEERHNELVARIRKRWSDLELRFIPCLEGQTDSAKQVIFERALYVARRFDRDYSAARAKARDTPPTTFSILLERKKELERLRKTLANPLKQLSETLFRIEEIQELEPSLSLDMPDLWQLIETTSARFLPWEAGARGSLEPLLRYARSTDQDGPDLADLLDAFREMVPDSIEFEHERIIRSEADKKNKIQAMVIALSRLIERDSEHLPSTYQMSETIHITDQAVADLVSVLFDFDDVSDVKTIRNRAGVAKISKKK